VFLLTCRQGGEAIPALPAFVASCNGSRSFPLNFSNYSSASFSTSGPSAARRQPAGGFGAPFGRSSRL